MTINELNSPGETPATVSVDELERALNKLKPSIAVSSFVRLLRKFHELRANAQAGSVEIMEGLLAYTKDQSGPARRELVNIANNLFPNMFGPQLMPHDEEDDRKTLPAVDPLELRRAAYRAQLLTLSPAEVASMRAPTVRPPAAAAKDQLPTLMNLDAVPRASAGAPDSRTTLIDDGTIAAEAERIREDLRRKDLGLDSLEAAWMESDPKEEK